MTHTTKKLNMQIWWNSEWCNLLWDWYRNLSPGLRKKIRECNFLVWPAKHIIMETLLTQPWLSRKYVCFSFHKRMGEIAPYFFVFFWVGILGQKTNIKLENKTGCIIGTLRLYFHHCYRWIDISRMYIETRCLNFPNMQHIYYTLLCH